MFKGAVVPRSDEVDTPGRAEEGPVEFEVAIVDETSSTPQDHGLR